MSADAVREFYAAPTPAGAVRVAIADHEAANVRGSFEYTDQLRRAVGQLERYSMLIAVLHYLTKQAELSDLGSNNDAIVKARKLLDEVLK